MCQQLFLAATYPLPEVPGENHPLAQYPYFGVYGPGEDSDWTTTNVRTLLKLPYVYHLMAHMSCGCGFTYADPSVYTELGADEAEVAAYLADRALGYYSVTSLGRYLSANLTAEPIFLYATWAAEEGQKPIEHFHTVTPAFFGGPSFAQLADNSVFRVERDSC